MLLERVHNLDCRSKQKVKEECFGRTPQPEAKSTAVRLFTSISAEHNEANNRFRTFGVSKMIPPMCLDEETSENDVRYGIDDCRRRLRSQRATLRALHHSPIDVSSSEAPTASYAEILTVSMSQGSLSKLVECLLGPSDSEKVESE